MRVFVIWRLSSWSFAWILNSCGPTAGVPPTRPMGRDSHEWTILQRDKSSDCVLGSVRCDFHASVFRNASILIGVVLLALTQPAIGQGWAQAPMEQLTPVILSIEEGGVSESLRDLVPQIREELNIDLKIVTGPFEQQFLQQYRDLLGGTGQFDIVIHWPTYVAEYYPHLRLLKSIPPGGEADAVKDLQLDDVFGCVSCFCYRYQGELVSTQIDGDVKILHYRKDLSDRPAERAEFRKRFGYDLDMEQLTWARYMDVAEFFTRPNQGLFGTGEIAGFFLLLHLYRPLHRKRVPFIRLPRHATVSRSLCDD